MNRRKFIKLACFGGAAALLASYPVFIERNIVLINNYQIPLPNLPSSFHKFRIVHLTDMHYGFLVSASFIKGVIDKANSLNPDLIVCTGDYVHSRNSTAEIDAVWPILLTLRAKHGVCSVLGNHDHWADAERSIYWLEKSGQSVRHKCKAVYIGNERILIGGAGDFLEDDLKIDQAFSSSNENVGENAAENPDKNDFRILLAHNPDSLDTQFKTPLSLALCGHTHGGQVSLPFYGPPVLPVINKRYSSGIIKTEKTTLFISKGIGWAIYPVRLNCFPEIAVLELVQSRNSTKSV